MLGTKHGYQGYILSALLCFLLVFSAGYMKLGSETSSVKDNDDRVAFLRGMGWEVNSMPLSAQYTVLPDPFPPVLEEYNALQLQQGYDLLPYAGKTVNIFTYQTEDDHDGAKIYCTLYIFQGNVIGGDTHTISLNGAMFPLRRDSKNG